MKYKYNNKKYPEYNFEGTDETIGYEKLAKMLNAKYINKVPYIRKVIVKQLYSHKEITFYGYEGERWIFEIDTHF